MEIFDTSHTNDLGSVRGRSFLGLKKESAIENSDVIEAEDPKCKMWFLERRWNKLYSKNPNAKIDDETGETIKNDLLAQLADKLAEFVED